MENKFRSIVEKHKYFISIFVFFVVYNFVIVGSFSFPSIDRICYTFHLVDYSVGFLPEMLPGAIYNALFSTTNVNVVNIYVNILYHLFLLAVSFMLEKFLYKFDSKNRFIAFIIVLFFITGPTTFAMHTTEMGMLDMYWLFLTVALLVMVQNKYLKWFVPIIFVLSIFIHIGALISFIPFWALIVLFEASQKEKVSKSYMFIFGVSILLAAVSVIYFIAVEESNLYLSLESFRKLINERNDSEWTTWTTYYEYALYRISYLGNKMEMVTPDGNSSFLIRVFGAFLRQIEDTFALFPGVRGQYYVDFARDTLLSIPIIAFLYKFVVMFFKKEKENKLRRFVWFCGLCLLPFVFIMSIFCSIDLIRWYGHGVICLFTLVLYKLYRSPDVDYFETLNNKINPSSYPVVIIYFVFYMMCVVNPYT